MGKSENHSKSESFSSIVLRLPVPAAIVAVRRLEARPVPAPRQPMRQAPTQPRRRL